MQYQVIGLLSGKVCMTGKSKDECYRLIQQAYPSLESLDRVSYSLAGIDHMVYKQKEKVYDESNTLDLLLVQKVILFAIVPVNVKPDYLNELIYVARHRRTIAMAKTGI